VVIQVPLLTLNLVPLNPGDYYSAPRLSLSLSAFPPSFHARNTFSPPRAGLTLVAYPPAITADPVGGEIIYRLWLSGAENGLPDLPLPLANLQFRRGGAVDYLSVTVPAAAEYRAGIEARPAGRIIVYRGSRFITGVEQLNEFISALFKRYRVDDGSRSASVILEGESIPDTVAAKRRTLSGISYQSTSAGKFRVRCSPDTYLRPGDTAVTLNNEFTVGEIVCYLTPTTATMEVTAG